MRTSPGEAIALGLARNGISQAGFAKRMRVSEATVSRWVNGATFPRPEQIPIICSVLGISSDEIFSATGKGPTAQKTLEGELLAAIERARVSMRAALDRLDADVKAARSQHKSGHRDTRGAELDLEAERANLEAIANGEDD